MSLWILWPEQAAPACLSRAPPPTGVDRLIPPSPVGYGGQAEPFFDDPFPACHGVAERRRDYDTEPVYLSSEVLA